MVPNGISNNSRFELEYEGVLQKWQLFREARKKFRDKVRIAKFNQLVLQQLNAEANSSLSSTYYSINRTAGAQLLLYFKEWDFPGLLIWFLFGVGLARGAGGGCFHIQTASWS